MDALDPAPHPFGGLFDAADMTHLSRQPHQPLQGQGEFSNPQVQVAAAIEVPEMDSIGKGTKIEQTAEKSSGFWVRARTVLALGPPKSPMGWYRVS